MFWMISLELNDADFEKFPNKSFRLYKLNLLKKLNINFQYNYIFHLAAIVGVSNVIKSPYKVLTNNILILEKVIEFAKKQKKLKRFFFIIK